LVVVVGLGGTWDSTNVMDADVAVLTPISLDHQRLLGTTVEAIAAQKGGIIKQGATAVVGVQSLSVLEVLSERVHQVGATLVLEGRDVGVLAREVAVGGQLVSLRGRAADYEDLFLPLHGEHQAHNLCCAVAAVEAFVGGGEQRLDANLLRAAVAGMDSPGRLEVVRRSPTVLVDAAHNPGGAQVLAAAVAEAFSFTHLVGVVAVLADKDAAGILDALEPILDEVVLTRTSSHRASDPDDLAAIARDIFDDDRVHVVASLPDALDLAVTLAEREGTDGPYGAGVLATGSVTMAADVRMLLGVRS
jgi:dihydrofolate synthase/folylpolyglutamate synthase